MRHAEHNLADAKLATTFEDLFECRHQGFATINTETLGADIFGVKIVFETFGFDQTLKDGFLATGGELRLVADAFDTLLNPGFLFRFLDMHEFDTDRPAIGFACQRDDLTDGRGFKAKNIGDEDRTIHVGFGKAIGLRIKFRMRFTRCKAQRIQVRFKMAAYPEGADQHQSANGIIGGSADGIRIYLTSRGCCMRCRCIAHLGRAFGMPL